MRVATPADLPSSNHMTHTCSWMVLSCTATCSVACCPAAPWHSQEEYYQHTVLSTASQHTFMV